MPIGVIKTAKVEKTPKNGPLPFPPVFLAFDARMADG